MTTTDQMAEKSVREHEARLKHIDELMAKADKAATDNEAVNDELAELKQQREKMGNYIEGLKQKSPQEFMETAGPMVMWEIVAEKLEQLIEKLKKGS